MFHELSQEATASTVYIFMLVASGSSLGRLAPKHNSRHAIAVARRLWHEHCPGLHKLPGPFTPALQARVPLASFLFSPSRFSHLAPLGLGLIPFLFFLFIFGPSGLPLPFWPFERSLLRSGPAVGIPRSLLL